MTRTVLPKVSINLVLKKQQKIHSSLLRFAGSILDGRQMGHVALTIMSSVPETPIGIIAELLRPMAGIILTRDVLDSISWRVAGNAHTSKEKKSIPSSRVVTKDWFVAEVVAVERAVREQKVEDEWRQVNGWRITFKALTGWAAGQTLESFRKGECANAIRVPFGFSKFIRSKRSRHADPTKEYPINSAVELYGCFVWVSANTERTKEDDFVVAQFESSSATIKHNRELFKMRKRLTHVCPKGLAADVLPCYMCDSGRDFCPAACRRISLEVTGETQ